MTDRPGAWSALPPGWVLVSVERLDEVTVATSTAEAVAYSGRCSCVAETVIVRRADTLADVEVALCGCTGRAAQLLPAPVTAAQIDAARDKLSARLTARADDRDEPTS